MSPRRPLLALAALALSLPLGGCLESPYATGETERSCGEAAQPCRLDDCELACATTVADSAASCMLTLEGSLDPDRTRCSFSDGSSVRFARPLPAAGVPLDDRRFELTITRGGQPCVTVAADPVDLDAPAGASGSTTITLPAGTYRQTVRLAPRGGGDGGPTLRELTLRCPDGTHYIGGLPLCGSCEGGDCGALPLIGVAASWTLQDVLEISLTRGARRVPLFTCQ
mgnify:CR=1 FL=1